MRCAPGVSFVIPLSSAKCWRASIKPGPWIRCGLVENPRMTPWHPSAHGPRPSRTRALAAALALAVAPGIATAASGDRDWPIYHGDPEGTHYSPLARIHRGNVAALKPVWVYRSGDHGRGASTTIECNPLIIDGTLYGTTPGLKVFALDATTGRELWHFDPWDGRPGRGVNRGLAWWSSGDDRRLYFAAGVRLYALNARTGRPVAEFG